MQKLGERQELWLEALESGDYPKGVFYLNCKGKYSCIGVAFEVAMQHGLAMAKTYNNKGFYYDDKISTASEGLIVWIGFYPYCMLYHPILFEHKINNEVDLGQFPKEEIKSLYGINDAFFLEDNDFTAMAKLIRDMPKLFFKEVK